MRQAIGVAVHAEISLLMTDKYPIKLQSPNNLLKSGQTTVGFHPEPQHVRGESVDGNKLPAQNTRIMYGKRNHIEAYLYLYIYCTIQY